MDLRSYLNLYQVLEEERSTKEQRRAFGLSHTSLKEKPFAQLSAWVDAQTAKLEKPLLGETFSSYLYGITLTIAVAAFIFGFLSGIGLLSYNGHEPVNVIYFIAMVVFLPLFTMAMTLFAMIRANKRHSLLIHISPAFWMEKILHLLPHKTEDRLKHLKINPLLVNWIVIKRSQLLALSFSFGLLLALLGMVATKDIAFAWSTTLHITPQEFHTFLNTLSFAWREWFPQAVPSIGLIEQSQYFRLGDTLSKEMVGNAAKLGEWWQFLAFATLFYAIILRFFIYLLSLFGFKRALRKSFLSLNGVQILLKEMNEPIISTHAKEHETVFRQADRLYDRMSENLDTSYDLILGWAIQQKQLQVICDSMEIVSSNYYGAGGSNTLEEDSKIVDLSYGRVLLFVKAWEPPTMDFMDFLDELSRNVEKVTVCAVGTAEKSYIAEAREIDVWARKLSSADYRNVWLKSNSRETVGKEEQYAG